jgi:hypothetical protein
MSGPVGESSAGSSGASYGPVGRSARMETLVHEIPGLAPVGAFGWMDRQGFPGAGPPHRRRRRMAPGVERWAGVGSLSAAAVRAPWRSPKVTVCARAVAILLTEKITATDRASRISFRCHA